MKVRTVFICNNERMPEPTDVDQIVRLRDVRVEFDGHAALRGIDLSARAGELLAVVGANGSGKSTLLSVVAGLQQPTAGDASLRAGARVALVPQTTADGARLPLTVADLVAMGRWRERGAFRPLRRTDRVRIADAIAAVGLEAHAKRPLGVLSGGQRQRAFLGQALAQDADLLLLDEPMSGLDSASREAAASAIAAVAARGAAVIAVTHDLAELGAVDQVVHLADGRIVARGDSPDASRGRTLDDATSVRA